MVKSFFGFIRSGSLFIWLPVGLLVLIQTFQFVTLLAYFFSFFPAVSHVDFAPPQCTEVYPKRDSQIYWLGILFFNGMFLYSAMLGHKNKEKKCIVPVYWAILAEALVLLVLFAGLNLKLSGDQVIARPNAFLIIGIILTFVTKTMLKWTGNFVSLVDSRLLIAVPVNDQPPVFTRRWFCLLVLVSLFCISGFLIHDIHALFDVAYFWERQQTNQTFTLAAAYWDFSGGLPGVDGEALFGVGLPVLIGQMCKLAGTFDWEMIFQAALWCIIVYTVFWFVLYSRVFRSPLLALAVWFLFLKFRLLSAEGGALFTMINWNASPIRYYGDVFFLIAICAHWSSRKRAWLILAACIGAFQLFLVTSVGAILCFLMGIYLCIYIAAHTMSDPRSRGRAFKDSVLAIILSVLLYGSIMFAIYGAHLGQASFWSEYFIHFKLFNNGFSNGPYINHLFTDPGNLFLSIGFISLYLLSIGPGFCLVLQRQFTDIRPMMVVVLSFYGLLHHQHFIILADTSVMGRDAAIELFLVFIWYDILIEQRPRFLKQGISAVLLIGAIIFLINDPKWRSYPNFYHPRAQWPLSVDISHFKDYFDKTYAFEDDVTMIRQLTAPKDRVPIVSEHELMLLIKSHRTPFFFVFPLVYSDQIGRAWFPQDQIFTIDRMQRTIDQIKDQKPPVIFVERKLFQVPLPAPYHGIQVPLVQILTEVLKSYEPQTASPYLIAFRRKNIALVP